MERIVFRIETGTIDGSSFRFGVHEGRPVSPLVRRIFAGGPAEG